jgi:hypothetical protein
MAKEFQVKVGILTATPRAVLDVYGVDSDIIFGSDTGGQQGYFGNSQRSSFGNILFAKNLKGVASSNNFKTIGTSAAGNGYSAIELTYGGNVNIYGSDSATTTDTTVTPVRLVKIIGSNGNVGIGTASDPVYKLEVNGIGYFVGNVGIGTASSPAYKLEVNGTGYFGDVVKIAGINNELNVGNLSSGQFAYIGNSQRVSFGNVLIAKNLGGVPSADTFKTLASLGSGAGYSAIELCYGGAINFYGSSAATTAGSVVTPTKLISVLGNGNVGIGVTPSYKLHVLGTTYFDGVVTVNNQKITGIAAATNPSDAVRYDQFSAGSSKWTLSGSDIYRQSKVYIGSSTPEFNFTTTIQGDYLYLKGATGMLQTNQAGVAYEVIAPGSSDNARFTGFKDLYLQSNNGTNYVRVRQGGATTIGTQPTSAQHALHIEGLSTENLAAMRVIFRNNKNNNLQIGDAVNSWIACHNLGSAQVVDLGNKNGTVLTRVNYDFETARETRLRFDGNQFGNLIQTSQIKKKIAGYINSDSSQTQTNCSILFNCNYSNTGTHKFLVTVEGTISGKYFNYRGIISFTSGTINALVSAAAGNDITDCTLSVNGTGIYPYLIITKTTGTFANTSLCITTQATTENNNIDQQAPSIYSVVFS